MAIMRQSPTQGIRLLGSAELDQGQFLASMEQKSCVYDVPCSKTYHQCCNAGFGLELMKVNYDGPLLMLTAEFSIVKLSTVRQVDLTGMDYPQSNQSNVWAANLLQGLMSLQ
jgi:hypothetical protein